MLFILLSLLLPNLLPHEVTISKDKPIAASAAPIANNINVIANIFISLIVIVANNKKIFNPIVVTS